MLGRAVYCKTAKFPTQQIGIEAGLILREISFHGHAFSEVARFVDIAAKLDREMISEKLERDDSQDRHYVLGRFRQHDDVIGDFPKVLCTLAAGHRDDGPLTGFHLFDVVQIL
jgi:hypothetical protein